MAETITHAFVSPKSDSTDTTLVSASEWNDGHVFSGGLNGQKLVYDNTQPNNIRWTDGSAAYVENFIIPNPTTSPITNCISMDFTTTSTCIIQFTVYSAIITVGSVDSALNITFNGTLFIGDGGLKSGVGNITTRILAQPAGTYEINVSIASTGNANYLGWIIQAQALVIGI